MGYREASTSFTETVAFLGLRNEAQSRRQEKGDAGNMISLAVADNVDVDDEGGIIGRQGYAPSLSGTNITAAFNTRDNKNAYIVDDGVLIHLQAGATPTTLGNVSKAETYWAEAGNKVFMSTGFIVDGDTLLNWREEAPADPIVTASVGGLLSEGQYQVVLTRMTADGRETGSSDAVVISVPENGIIFIKGVEHCNVYVTECNGDVFLLAGYQVGLIVSTIGYNLPLADALFLGNALPEGLLVDYPGVTDITSTSDLPEQNVQCIAYYDSSMYVSVYDPVSNTSAVYWSDPFRWHIFDVFHSYIRIPGEVRMLATAGNVLAIGTDKEVMSYDGQAITKLARYGVARGHCYSYSRDGTLFFLSQRGVCKMPFENLTGDKVALPTGTFVSTAIIDKDGFERFVVLTDGIGETENSTIF